MSQSLGQTLGQTCPAGTTRTAHIGPAFGADMAIAAPVAAGIAMVIFVLLVMVINRLPGPLQTPGQK